MSTTVDLGKITASVTVGTTTTGAAGTNASVSNSGTTQDAVLNFTIPRGAQGVQGPQGIQGNTGPAGPTGPQGPMGDVAVITPEQQAAFTMYSTTGQNTDGPMTQKAVTDNFAGINTDNDADLDIADDSGNVLVRFNDGHVQTKNFDSKQLPAIATKNTEDYDFTIEDEAGDAIVLFQHGHVRTKNFNSETFSAANYLKDKFQGKKIAIVGDSISTYQGWLPSDVAGFTGTAYATYYPNGDVNSVDKTWWYQVALNLGILTSDIANTSWSGGVVCGDSTSITNGKPACSTKRISDIAIRGFNPDIIIVYIGCNDWYQCGLSGYSTILGTWAITDAVPAEGTIHAFRSAYALMLSKLQNTYPNARIFCCTILDDWKRDAVADDPSDNAWPSNDAAGYTTKQWNDNIKEIADAFACDVIDIHNCGITYYNIPSFAVDTGLHPNAAGHAMIARKVTSELMAKY